MEITDLLPIHGKVAMQLAQLAASLPVGARLPPERELAQRYAVSRISIRKAMEALREGGIVCSRQGSGTYVAQHAAQPAMHARVQAACKRLTGMLVPTVEWPSIARIVAGAERAASEQGGHLVLMHDHGLPAKQLEQMQSLSAQGLDGCLVFLDAGNVSQPEYIRLLQQLAGEGRRIVLLDRYLPEVNLPCVMTDVNRGMYELTQHLLMAGRRRLAVLSWGEAAGVAERERMAGFRRALQDQGLPVEPVLHGVTGYAGKEEQSVRRVIGAWLSSCGRPLPFDALVCFADTIAFHAYMALREAGVRVPQDIALTGFDDNFPELYHAHGLDLTTIEQPSEEIGAEGIRLLQAEQDSLRHRLLPPKLIIRTSCGSRR